MSPGVIVSLIAAGIVLMVLAAFIAQYLENARQERHRMVLAMQERTRTAWDILGTLPPAYLPAELRHVLLNYMTSCYRTMMTLEPRQQTAQAQAQLKNVEEQLALPYKSQLDSTEPAFNDQVTGQVLRSRVKAMVDLFAIIHQEGKLDRQQAQECINRGKILFEMISVDLNLVTARQMEQRKNLKLALAHYNNSLKRLQKLNGQGQLEQRVSQLQRKVEQLREQAKASGEQTAASEDQAKLNKEWDQFDQESAWKIKQDYE